MDPTTPAPLPTPESQPGRAILPEAMPQPALPEQASNPPAAAPVSQAPPTPPIAPPAAQVVPATDTPAPPVGSLPVIADDVDVIEQAWVDKADEIRKANQGDPHNEDEAVEVLQQQYLKQRYGRDVGKPSDK